MKLIKIHRLTCRCDDLIWTEDVFDSELNADDMTDFYAYYNWLFEGEWEVIEVVSMDVDKKAVKLARWRGFYRLYGTGDGLHV